MDRAQELGSVMRKWRLERGLKRPEVLTELQKLGVDMSYGYLAKLESGVRSLAAASVEFREGLRRVYRIGREEWERETGLYVPHPSPSPRDEVQLVNPDLRGGTRRIPVYDLLSAGPGGDGGTVIAEVDIPEAWKGEHAAYEVTGDSMAPRIPDGSTVIIRCQDYARPGSIIVAYAPEHGMLVKFFERATEAGQCVLTSFNPAYAPIWTDVDELRVYGVVREVRTRIELMNGEERNGNGSNGERHAPN